MKILIGLAAHRQIFATEEVNSKVLDESVRERSSSHRRFSRTTFREGSSAGGRKIGIN